MNLSGQSVGAAVNYYKIPTERVLVAYDELDLPSGRAQLRFDGGSAGHNGIEQRHRAHRHGVLAPALRHRPSARQRASRRRPQGSHRPRAEARGRQRGSGTARQAARSGRPAARDARARRRARQESPAHAQTGDRTKHGHQVRHRRIAERRQVDAVQRAHGGGDSRRELSVLHDRPERRRRHRAGPEARRARRRS